MHPRLEMEELVRLMGNKRKCTEGINITGR